MKKELPQIRQSVLRERQAILVLDHKGNFKCVYALRNDKVYQITRKGRKQVCKTIYLEDLKMTLPKH